MKRSCNWCGNKRLKRVAFCKTCYREYKRQKGIRERKQTTLKDPDMIKLANRE